MEESIKHFHAPIVVKADGLAAGKGVIICPTRHFAVETAQGLFSGELLGSAERQVVIEEFLEGEELSFLCLTDGKHVAPLVPAQDHKRIGEGDTGPNTGGMGVYSTSQMLEPTMTEWILHHIAEPTVRGMAEEGMPFVGVLYCGLMMTARGPQVLEYNARFGDPETQAILVRLESDLVEALEACIDGRLAETELRWSAGASACVVASSSGYPGSYKTGLPISGLSNAAQVPGVEIFHSGTTRVGRPARHRRRTRAGRHGQRRLARRGPGRAPMRRLSQIHFEGMYYRHDIGHRALKQPRAIDSHPSQTSKLMLQSCDGGHNQNSVGVYSRLGVVGVTGGAGHAFGLLLKTGAAEYRSALRRFEGNRRFRAARRTGRTGFGAHPSRRWRASPCTACSAWDRS